MIINGHGFESFYDKEFIFAIWAEGLNIFVLRDLKYCDLYV